MRSLFKYLIGCSALFIAGCAAFFSVKGLGVLFAGSAAAVMVMAASLELGKLVAASFLYRYWRELNIPLRIYLSAAVLLLIGITSLGIYGYLARAYEQTQSTIVLLEQQIATVQLQNANTQRQIDAQLAESARSSDGEREDLAKEQQRLADLNKRLDESLTRIEDRRASARKKRDADIALQRQRADAIEQVFRQDTATEEQLISEYAARIDALDRSVDAYTREGGGGLFKQDKIRLGQQLREQQKPERDAIAQAIAERHAAVEALRQRRETDAREIQKKIDAIDVEYETQIAGLGEQEQRLRDEHTRTIASADTRLSELRSATQSTWDDRDTRIKGLYQRLRTGHDEIARLQAQIAATDIGSYRFVARAMNAPVDDVVKWLILILVLVFDPLAVALTIGFNVAVMRDRPARSSSHAAARPIAAAAIEVPHRAPLASWAALTAVVLIVGVLLTVAGVAATGYWSDHRARRHAALIPAEAFAVVSLSRRFQEDPLASLERLVSPALAGQFKSLLSDGFSPDADIYAFLTFPHVQPEMDTANPVILLGLVAAVSDPQAAERSLAQFAETAAGSLLPGRRASVDRSRAMIRLGQGRYLDPEGGFFTFAVTPDAAIILLELEGDPRRPLIEREVRHVLLGRSSEHYTSAPMTLPAAATRGDATISLWFDARKCFAQMPKNAQAQTRYETLQRFLDFNLTLLAEPTGHHGLRMVGQYTYGVDRFDVADAQGLVDALTALGPSATAGMAGLLMDRCADTLDFDALIARLRQAMSTTDGDSPPAEIIVDQVVESQRKAGFVLNARFDDAVESPLTATLERLTPRER
jgi:hypothetical protein